MKCSLILNHFIQSSLSINLDVSHQTLCWKIIFYTSVLLFKLLLGISQVFLHFFHLFPVFSAIVTHKTPMQLGMGIV